MGRRIGCIVLLVIALGVVGLIIYKQKSSGKGGGGFSFAVKKKAVKSAEPNFEPVRRGDLTITVEATGTTEPISNIDVKSEATGRITELYVKEGSRLKRGHTIAKLDQSKQELGEQHSRPH